MTNNMSAQKHQYNLFSKEPFTQNNCSASYSVSGGFPLITSWLHRATLQSCPGYCTQWKGFKKAKFILWYQLPIGFMSQFLPPPCLAESFAWKLWLWRGRDHLPGRKVSRRTPRPEASKMGTDEVKDRHLARMSESLRPSKRVQRVHVVQKEDLLWKSLPVLLHLEIKGYVFKYGFWTGGMWVRLFRGLYLDF